jgi:hypothetical protein
MAQNIGKGDKPLLDVEKFVGNVNKKDKVSGLKLRLPIVRRRRHGH